MERDVAQAFSPMALDRSQLSVRCGCLAKLDGETLGNVVGEAFHRVPGAGSPPTAHVEDCAHLPAVDGSILASVDFGPVVCPDLFRAGRIAAVHALSDIYASGGGPVAALATLIVDSELDDRSLADLIAGIADGCTRDGVPLLGGHTIVGEETIAGLAVIGQHDAAPVGKRGAGVGDRLMLSKPLGIGLMLRAFRQGAIGSAELEPALASMERSNREASQAVSHAGVNAATDVTGFGLLGHLAEMVDGTGLGARLDFARIPTLAGARGLPDLFYRSSWIERNIEYCRGKIELFGKADRTELGVLADPQTSGGLLVAVEEESARALREAGFEDIGTVTGNARLEVS